MPDSLKVKVPVRPLPVYAASIAMRAILPSVTPVIRNTTKKIREFCASGALIAALLAGDSSDISQTKDKTYSRHMYIVVLDESDTDKTDGVVLFDGPEDEDPYKYLPYEEVEGRGLGVGVVEDLFEAQVWTNYTVKQKKDLLDLAGKIIFRGA